MIVFDRSQPVRRKAVWGPKRVALATVILVAFGLSANGIANAVGLSETAALNAFAGEKDLVAFQSLAHDQSLRMDRVYAAAIHRALKKTNDAQVASLLNQLHAERDTETTVGALALGEGGIPQRAEHRSQPKASRNPNGRSPLTTQSTIGSPVTKARPGRPNFAAKPHKLDLEIERRMSNPRGSSSVIVELAVGAALPAEFKRFARKSGNLSIINGQVLDLPNSVIRQLEARSEIAQVHHNREISADNYRTSFTTGAKATERGLGLTGAGVGVAIIDSGIATWHDDLTSQSASLYPYGNQRVAAFVDLVNGQLTPYDDQGHGTHVAGIIGGNGYDSNGRQMGVAPGASIVSLKVLDANGQGTVSNIIAALDWVLANHAQYNIRVVNLSVGAIVTESYWTDPLTLAAKRVVDAGVVVVSAAGNRGRNAAGDTQYGGITAPGNAPWVISVGASSTNGNTQREDDTIASFSSRGPTYLDWSAKPDLVAPGRGTISLADPLGAFYTSKAQYLQDGSVATAYRPYLALSGTSMAAPVVAGTIAQMLQANPSLTPNAVKAILQYTAQEYPNYDPLTQGAGFLNAVGAVRLSAFYATAEQGQPVPVQAMWSKHLIWGNHLVSGGLIVPASNAFEVGTDWGVVVDDDGDNIVWGTTCDDNDCDNIVWGAFDDDNIVWGTENDGDNIVWGTEFGDDNIVWGTDCGGDDCDNIVWGTSLGDNIVWGTGDDDDNIVWGTSDDDDNIVWGTIDDDNIVWGTDDDDNIVWGTSDGDNIVWGTDGDDNIVWGTDEHDNIVWGTSLNGEIVWVNPNGGPVQQLQWSDMLQRLTDEQIFTILSSLSGGPRPIPPVDDNTPGDVPPPPTDPGNVPPPPPADPGDLPPPPSDTPPPPVDPGVTDPGVPPPPADPGSTPPPPPPPDSGLEPPPPPPPVPGVGGGL